jgi:hypothetical protein
MPDMLRHTLPKLSNGVAHFPPFVHSSQPGMPPIELHILRMALFALLVGRKLGIAASL